MNADEMNCPFCSIQDDLVVFESNLAFAIKDGFPLSQGHTLVIPRRQVASFFDLTEGEHDEMRALLIRSKGKLDAEFSPDGYNIGVNDGPAAGQTVGHLHVHLIPRYKGDAADPRGGIRWIIPEKADYWSKR